MSYYKPAVFLFIVHDKFIVW